MLTQMMLKSMTKSTGGMLGGEGYGNDIFDTVFETEISKHLTKSQGFGIAQSIYKKMTGEDLDMNTLKIGKRPNVLNARKINKDISVPIITPSNRAEIRLQKYDDVIKEKSNKYNVPENLVKSIILTESAAKENALSKANAKGLMQLIDSTATDMGVKNVWNPAQNIEGGTKYISKMLKKYDGDVELSLAAYNAGPGNVDKYNGIPPFDETQKYVKRVLGYLNYLDE